MLNPIFSGAYSQRANVMTKRRTLGVEPLEERRVLAVIAGATYNPPDPGNEVEFIAPAQGEYVPIALPNGIVPPGTSQLSPLPAGELPGFVPIPLPGGLVPPGTSVLVPPADGSLPPGLPDLSGLAETYSVNLAVSWLRAHDNAVGDVGQGVYQNCYTLALEVHDAQNFVRYGVSEAANQIGASYVVRDGTHSEILALREISSAESISQSDPSTLDGGLVYCQFDNDILSAAVIRSETAGVVTIWQYPNAPDPGLTPGEELDALNALVGDHLDGPAAGAVQDTFHFAVDQYFAQVPEPASITLAILAAGGLALVARKRAGQSTGTI
jgi:hypothetical protein